ncbi:MAG: RimK family protein [Pseudomonadota bacterium]
MGAILVVVNNPADWPLSIPGVAVVAARDYLGAPASADRRAKVYNLCKSYRYQSLGYYVSLLAEARGHKPLPRASTIEDLQSANLLRLLTENLKETVQRMLTPLAMDTLEFDVYFGACPEPRYRQFCRQIFNLLQAPLLRIHFVRRDNLWRLRGVRLLGTGDIPAAQKDWALQAAAEFFQAHRPLRRPAPRFDLAILHDPDDAEPPSNAQAMRKFQQAADKLGLHAELITHADFQRLPQFDALFIRSTTGVNHYTYRFARRAAAEGLALIDDPDSILKCNNKVYLAELLAAHGVATPRTLVVHRGNVDNIATTLGLPCVLKLPDSAFSLGVFKAENESELRQHANALLARSELIVAQEYLPTPFDWRIGILDRQPLFACQYFMVDGHWQIIQHNLEGTLREGATVAVPLDEVPPAVMKLALKAAGLIGDGFYGVDVKQSGRRCCVIEVNDNPNVDAGNEDGVRGDTLYRDILAVLLKRIQNRQSK